MQRLSFVDSLKGIGILFGYAKTDNRPLKLFFAKKAVALLLPYVSFLTVYAYTMGKSVGGAFFDEEVHYGYWFNPCLFLIIVFDFFY